MAPTSQDDAAKQRIISHMNADHHDSIVRYLEHYARLPSWSAYDGEMVDVDLQSMTLLCHGKQLRIPFEPAMTSFREARDRVVEMDRECLHALGKSDITIRDFVPPTGLYALEFAIVLATFLSYSQRHWFGKGYIVERMLGSRFAAFSWTIQPWLIAFMIGLHSAELLYFIPSRLRKHSVNIRTLVWWKWAVSVFVEGQFAFKRFGDLVERKKEEKQKQKH